MKIETINDLREHALQTLQKLSDKKINVEEAGVTGKLYEGIISSVKIELEYARLTDTSPDISFLGKNKVKIKTITEIKPKKLSKLK